MLTDTRERVIAVAVTLAILAGGALLARSALGRPRSPHVVPVVFACFYLGSFFAGANWSYRLVVALMLVGQVRLPLPRLTPGRWNDVFRLEGLLVLTVVSLLWLTPLRLSAVWQVALAVVSTAIVLVSAAGLRRKIGLGTQRSD